MPCAEYDRLYQAHRAMVQRFRESIRDLVALVDLSVGDSGFSVAHLRVRAARGACELARATLEHHKEEHGC